MGAAEVRYVGCDQVVRVRVPSQESGSTSPRLVRWVGVSGFRGASLCSRWWESAVMSWVVCSVAWDCGCASCGVRWGLVWFGCVGLVAFVLTTWSRRRCAACVSLVCACRREPVVFGAHCCELVRSRRRGGVNVAGVLLVLVGAVAAAVAVVRLVVALTRPYVGSACKCAVTWCLRGCGSRRNRNS